MKKTNAMRRKRQKERFFCKGTDVRNKFLPVSLTAVPCVVIPSFALREAQNKLQSQRSVASVCVSRV